MAVWLSRGLNMRDEAIFAKRVREGYRQTIVALRQHRSLKGKIQILPWTTPAQLSSVNERAAPDRFVSLSSRRGVYDAAVSESLGHPDVIIDSHVFAHILHTREKD
jgi:hypothetical protein